MHFLNDQIYMKSKQKYIAYLFLLSENQKSEL